MSAVADMRAMVERLIQAVADRGDKWQDENSLERLALNAAGLLKGVANALESMGIDLAPDEAG